jgi:hypothetical protein
MLSQPKFVLDVIRVGFNDVSDREMIRRFGRRYRQVPVHDGLS